MCEGPSLVGQTFWEPCRAVPLCSLLCGLGRMVGGNVQMGPCSPSSASPSLQRRVKSQGPWVLGFRGVPSTRLSASPLPRQPHSPKCQVGSYPGCRAQVITQVPINWPPHPCPEQGPCWCLGAQGWEPAGQARPLHVRVLGAGLLAVPLRLPALVAVNELGEERGLLGVTRDELVLQELFGGGPLRGWDMGQQARGWLGSALQTLGGAWTRLGYSVALPSRPGRTQ